jgi:hypothetical protein
MQNSTKSKVVNNFVASTYNRPTPPCRHPRQFRNRTFHNLPAYHLLLVTIPHYPSIFLTTSPTTPAITTKLL